MTKAPELLPCPFCGGKAIYHPDHTTEYVDSIYCEACDAQVSDFNLSGGQGACRELWNTRTPDAAAALERVKQEARNEALREVYTAVEKEKPQSYTGMKRVIERLITEGQSDGE